MAITLEEFEKQARQLSLQEKASLIENLISSLDDVDEAECERLWIEEAKRRYKEYKAGNISSSPANDAFRNTRAKLRAI